MKVGNKFVDQYGNLLKNTQKNNLRFSAPVRIYKALFLTCTQCTGSRVTKLKVIFERGSLLDSD